jgi:glycosyltransferase involved in cell wall biosynthesis
MDVQRDPTELSAMTSSNPTIAYVTAGAAGMFCGSCLRDNSLALALRRRGCQLILVPTYTPIRTDEDDASTGRVFFGGINVYLQQKSAVFRYLPGFLDRWLDHPRLIGWAAGRAGTLGTNAAELGALAVSMLRGERGNQRKEVRRLVEWLATDVKPDLVNLTNVLIAGCVPEIKRRLGVPVLATLQGDDVFLDDLPEPFRQQAFAEIRRLAGDIDAYLTFSAYYADFMTGYLGIKRDRVHVVPLGINVADFGRPPAGPGTRPPSVGYLARICPAKGFHVLVDAFLLLSRMPEMESVRLHAAGWLSDGDRSYLSDQQRKLDKAGLSDRFRYAGVLDRRQKIEFLSGLDVFSVPSVYREPKGLYVLEALASGVPVVQPAHGTFPELLASTGGGRLVPPNDPPQLASALHALLIDPAARLGLGETGRSRVNEAHTADVMAAETLEVYRRILEASPASRWEVTCSA